MPHFPVAICSRRLQEGTWFLLRALNYLKQLIWQWLIACFNFPLTMSAVGGKKRGRAASPSSPSLSEKRAMFCFVLFCFEKKNKQKKKHARRNPAGPGSSINHAAHLEQRRHAPLNTQHQSVVDSALIRPLMMTYNFFYKPYFIYFFWCTVWTDWVKEWASEANGEVVTAKSISCMTAAGEGNRWVAAATTAFDLPVGLTTGP